MKIDKKPFNKFYQGTTLVESTIHIQTLPPEDGRVCKGDDLSSRFLDVTIYPGFFFEYTNGTGKA